MGYEFELKFAANEAQQNAILDSYPGNYHLLEMETKYYDTASHQFSSKHYSLRKRMENSVSICNLKIPLDENRRGEWECEDNDIVSGAKQLAQMCGNPEIVELVETPLIEICGAKFTRKAILLKHNNTSIELAIDRGYVMAGDKTAPISEVEVELKDGAESDASEFARLLAQRFDLSVEPKSKFARAKALMVD